MKKILIVYYTKTNTTKEYAEYIKAKLESENVIVDMLKFEEVKNLSEYNLVVVGAPINGMMWKEDATNFVKENSDVLIKLPTFYFFVTYIYENGRKMWKKMIESSINKVNKIVTPVSYYKFGGRLEARMPKIIEYMFGIKNQPLNIMNYELVDKFINEIKNKLEC